MSQQRPSSPQSSASTASNTIDENAMTSNPRMLRAKAWAAKTLHHMQKHVGIGAICAVAYFDPGNWSVDLQAGSEFGYKLLFVVLLAGIMAVIFQSMASRLGCVTGLDLASHCRMLLHNRPKHTLWYRWGLLYPLYALAEIAIISTDLAELLGSATALVLLFPGLPLYAGVLITASDVLIILAFCDPTRGRPVRLFELLIASLVLAVFICLIYVVVQVDPDLGDTFEGYLPSSALFKPGSLYISIGIVGATVMPHGLFLGSSLATQDRISPAPFHEKALSSSSDLPLPSTSIARKCANGLKSSIFKFIRLVRHSLRFNKLFNKEGDRDLPNTDLGHAGWTNRPLSFVRAHLYHGIVDVVLSLLGFAVVINSLILIIASAVFFYGSGGGEGDDAPADLFEAFDLIKVRVGKAAAILFALALLCAGESASITATLAGQVVSEGFLRWGVSPLLRRTITRLIGLIPSMLVAVIVGRRGINDLLVASQVVLSFVLPFVAFPLVYITSSPELMKVRRDNVVAASHDPTAVTDTSEKSEGPSGTVVPTVTAQVEETVSFNNSKPVMFVGYAIWLIVVVANGYVLISLATGNSG